MAINKILLEKVKQHILEEPRRFDMLTFGSRSNEAPCGTVACIAGWAIELSGRRLLSDEGKHLHDTPNLARELLGLTKEEGRALFLPSSWPKKYERAWREAKTVRGEARAAARYIDHIIKTGKVTD